MLFSSISFLYVFLPAVLLCYTLVPRRWKNAVLLVFSLLFYAAGEPVYISLLLLSSILNYIYALLVEKFRGRRGAKIALVSSIVCNLLLLGFFKYADFLIGAVNGLLGTDIPLLKIPLPIGISFFTFQTMSYVIDVYRGEVPAERNIVMLGAYVSLFPQLIAGPIVRYRTVCRRRAALYRRPREKGADCQPAGRDVRFLPLFRGTVGAVLLAVCGELYAPDLF